MPPTRSLASITFASLFLLATACGDDTGGSGGGDVGGSGSGGAGGSGGSASPTVAEQNCESYVTFVVGRAIQEGCESVDAEASTAGCLDLYAANEACTEQIGAFFGCLTSLSEDIWSCYPDDNQLVYAAGHCTSEGAAMSSCMGNE